MSKFFFMPYDIPTAEDQKELDAWDKSFTFCKTHRYHKKFNQGSGMKDLGMFDELYVIGHGDAGSQYITSGDTNKFGGVESLCFVTIAKRIQDCGLRTSFGGALKVWACYSGEAKGNAPAFADLLARHMYQKLGYTACKFIGYEGKLGAYRSKEKGDWVKHSYTYVTKKGKGGERRASKYRVIFDGRDPYVPPSNG